MLTDVDIVDRQCFIIEHHIVRGKYFIYLIWRKIIENKTRRYYGKIAVKKCFYEDNLVLFVNSNFLLINLILKHGIHVPPFLSFFNIIYILRS